MRSKRFFDFLSKIILAVFMSFSLVYPMTTTLLFPYSALIILGYVSIATIIYSVMFINRLTARISAVLIIAATGVGIFILAASQKLHHIIDIVIWLVNYINDDTELVDIYAFVLTLLFCIAFSLFVYIFTIKKFNFYFIALSGIILFSSQWMFDFFVDKAYISFYTFIASIIVYYLMHIYSKKILDDSNELVRPSVFILGIVPLCILVLFLTNSIPARSKPIEWKWLDNKINLAFDFLRSDKKTGSSVYDIGYFSLKTTGFANGNTDLGGNIAPNDMKILEVQTNNKIYLRGNAYNIYTGNSWISTPSIEGFNSPLTDRFNAPIIKSDGTLINIPDVVMDESMDIFELKKGAIALYKYEPPNDSVFNQEDNIWADPSDEIFYLYSRSLDYEDDGDILSRLASNAKIIVKFTDIKSNTIFAPLKSERFQYFSDKSININRNDEDIYTSTESLEKDFSYSFESFCPKLSNSFFQSILRKSWHGFYNDEIDRQTDRIYNILYDFYLDEIIVKIGRETSRTVWDSSNEAAVKAIIRNSSDKYNLGDELFEYLTNYFSREIHNPIDMDFSIYFLKSIGEFRELTPVNDFNDFKKLNEYSNKIYQRYLEVPPSVPQRVRDLAVSIAKDETNNYDKAKAIEKYLSSNYPYTLSPGDTPPEEDFVDYFLFEQKRGYCVYHASAMVILARSIGLPARYVEGFVLPPKTNSEGVYEVTNRQAHAWVEVYFEGFGWLTFEPTPAYSLSLYDSTRFGPDMSGMYPQPNVTNNNMNPVNTRDPNMPDYYPVYQEETNTVLRIILITAAVILTFFLIVLIIILINILRRKYRIKRILKMPPKEAVIELYRIYIKHLQLQNMPSIKGETPLEYADRLDGYKYLHPHKFNDIVSVFMKARYSRNEVTESDKNTFYQYYKTIDQKTRKSLGRYNYFFMAYLQGKI
ncbi:MAG TPA: transglutaminase domain-containing protein [Acetivibrio sp.]|nr:transglutaminase domain-containing protein [Acetivibrio sp.]